MAKAIKAQVKDENSVFEETWTDWSRWGKTPEEAAPNIVKWFNDTRRPHESERELVSFEVVEAKSKENDEEEVEDKDDLDDFEDDDD